MRTATALMDLLADALVIALAVEYFDLSRSTSSAHERLDVGSDVLRWLERSGY